MVNVGSERGFGYWDGDSGKAVTRPCVLIVHYGFDNSAKLDRSEDDKKDVQNIYAALQSVCRICEISASRNELLGYLGSEDKIRESFQLPAGEAPELLIVFIMTHGEEGGYLLACTEGDEKTELFTVTEVCDQLKSNPILENALKLLIVSACRGEIMEEVFHEKVRKNSINLPPTATWSSDLDPRNPKNQNAVRVTTSPDSDNFVIIFSCVEGTYSLRRDGTFLVGSFCECFGKLEKDVRLDEFLTRVKWYHHRGRNLERGYGSTPEVKILKHRPLQIRKQCEENRDEFDYKWMSNAKVPLLTRKAHFFFSVPASASRVKLADALTKSFEFEPKLHDSFEQLKSAVSDPSNEKDGCVLICVAAGLSKDNKSNEIFVDKDGEVMPAKKILSTLIHPTTKNWIGKPKICVFLNAPSVACLVATDGAPATAKKYEISDTVHAGFLTIFLPQEDAVSLFTETLKEFTKQENATFQQFFVSLLGKAKPASEIRPMVVSTLHTTLEIEFPSLIATESFKLTMPGHSWDVPLKILYQLISSGFHRVPQVQSSDAIGADGQSSLGTGAKPVNYNKTRQDDLRQGEEERSEHIVYVVSADAGSGKSNLVERLASRAKRSRSVTRIDLMVEAKFLRNFGWSKGYKAFIEEFRRHVGLPPRPFGQDEVVILDAIDALHGETLDNVLDLVRSLAVDEVDLWIFTRPQRLDRLQTELAGKCLVGVVEINLLTEDNQVKLLQVQGRKEAAVRAVLEKIGRAHADDLTCRIGTLEKLATFPGLFESEQDVNVYELSAHVVELAIKSYLKKRKKNSEVYAIELRDKIKKNLTSLATDYFSVEPKGQSDVKGKSFLAHFVSYPVVQVSGTLAAYLYISKGEITSAEQIDQLQIDPGRKIILRRMFEDEIRSAIHEEME